eukprot:5376155-Pyramimonas_sp.AAC.1
MHPYPYAYPSAFVLSPPLFGRPRQRARQARQSERGIAVPCQFTGCFAPPTPQGRPRQSET